MLLRTSIQMSVDPNCLFRSTKNNFDISLVSEISFDYCVSEVEYSETKRRIIFVLIFL